MQQLLVLQLVATVAATDTFGAFAQFGELDDHTEKVESQQPHVVILAVKTEEEVQKKLDRELRRKSDPDNIPEYASWFSAKEMRELARPQARHIDAVRKYFEGFVNDKNNKHARLQFSKGNDLARFVCSVSCIEKAFGTALQKVKLTF